MEASFINERHFKTYNIVQYSPENDVLNILWAQPFWMSGNLGAHDQNLMKWLHKWSTREKICQKFLTFAIEIHTI